MLCVRLMSVLCCMCECVLCDVVVLLPVNMSVSVSVVCCIRT